MCQSTIPHTKNRYTNILLRIIYAELCSKLLHYTRQINNNEQYHTTLSTIFDEHTPLVSKTIWHRPTVPWYTDEIKQEKQERKRRE